MSILSARLMHAEGLLPETSRPYFVIQMTFGSTSYDSKAVKKSGRPSFIQDFTFPLDADVSPTLCGTPHCRNPRPVLARLFHETR